MKILPKGRPKKDTKPTAEPMVNSGMNLDGNSDVDAMERDLGVVNPPKKPASKVAEPEEDVQSEPLPPPKQAVRPPQPMPPQASEQAEQERQRRIQQLREFVTKAPYKSAGIPQVVKFKGKRWIIIQDVRDIPYELYLISDEGFDSLREQVNRA